MLSTKVKTVEQPARPVRLPVLYGFLAAAVVAIGVELLVFPNLASSPGFLALIIFTTLFSFGSLGLSLSGVRARLPRWAKWSVTAALWSLVALDLTIFLALPFLTTTTSNEPAPTFVSSKPANAASATSVSGGETNMAKPAQAMVQMVQPVSANLPSPPNLDKKQPAPDFDNQTWINSEKLDLAALKGKVVLVEFWTFGCVNCQNVQPSLKRYYEGYNSKGLEIVAFHAPEFDYEKKLENVQTAVKERGLKYPIAIDNDFKTWGKYGVRAWPTLFLVDKQGQIRYTHIGEGNYELTEAAIVALLNEAT